MLEQVLEQLLFKRVYCQPAPNEPQMDEFAGKMPDFDSFTNPLITYTSRWDFVKGFKFEFQSPLTQYFLLSHSWVIPNTTAAKMQNPLQAMMKKGNSTPMYQLSAQCLMDVQNMQPNTIISTRSDSTNKLQVMVLRRLSDMFSVKFSANFFKEIFFSQSVIDLIYERKNQNTTFRAILSPNDTILSFSTLQRITENLSLGFGYNNHLNRRSASFSYGGQYNYLGKHKFYFSYSAFQMTYLLGYLLNLKKGTSLFSKFEVAPTQQNTVRTTTIVGFKQRYQGSQVTVMVNSRAKVSAMLNIFSQILSLKLCAIVDVQKSKYKFGYGVQMGAQG